MTAVISAAHHLSSGLGLESGHRSAIFHSEQGVARDEDLRITFDEPRSDPWTPLDRNTPIQRSQHAQDLITAFDHFQIQLKDTSTSTYQPTSSRNGHITSKTSSKFRSCASRDSARSSGSLRSGGNRQSSIQGDPNRTNRNNDAEKGSGQSNNKNPPTSTRINPSSQGKVQCPLVNKNVGDLPKECGNGFPDVETSIKHANKVHFRCVICLNEPKQPQPRVHNNAKTTKPIIARDIYFKKKIDLNRHTKTHLCHIMCPEKGCNERFHKKQELDNHTKKFKGNCRVDGQAERDTLMNELDNISKRIDACGENDPSKLAEEHAAILLFPQNGNGKRLKKYDWKDGTNRLSRTDTAKNPAAVGKDIASDLNEQMEKLDERSKRKLIYSLIGELPDDIVDMIQDISAANNGSRKRVRRASSSSLADPELGEDDTGQIHRPQPKVRKQVHEVQGTGERDPTRPLEYIRSCALENPGISTTYNPGSSSAPQDYMSHQADSVSSDMNTSPYDDSGIGTSCTDLDFEQYIDDSYLHHSH